MVDLEPRREQYTVGWVCALPTEASAAQAMLDETYSALPSRNAHDSNVYSFGSVCNHKVVIALLPSGVYGTTSAATTGKEILLSFPNIRFGLLVGVGGGVPSEENDIRLGDVVVSKPDGDIGGVLQLDLGNQTTEGFQRTGSLNKPPSVLLKAIALLESRHDLHGSRDVPKHISETYRKFPTYATKAKHPGLDQDRLFEADYDHFNAQSRTCQDCDEAQVVDRDSRENQDPVMHYGLIGSGNRVIKNSHVRDRLVKQDILCVEMEAAGVMDIFPCLVIRGICDYCDSHKNKRWQSYAALAAAAYAKELLSTIPVLEVEAAPVALDILQGTVNEVKEGLKEVAQQNKESRQETYNNKIRKWLSPAYPHTNYERALRTRHYGSGTWFLQSQQYLQWKSSLKSSLWLYGSAGCGKTVLTSSILKDLHSETGPNPFPSSSPMLLYFFFDFREVEKQSLEEMARSLAYQMYTQDKNFQQPLDSLLKTCDNGYRKPSTESLLRILIEALLTRDRKVYLVLDALDECILPRQDLLAWIKKIAGFTSWKLHLLVTSRKEPDIDLVLGRPYLMDQRAAVQTNVVDEDIRAYMIHRLRTDNEFKRWKNRDDIKQMIQESLMRMSNGMFRWAVCQLDALSRCVNQPALENALDALPPTLDDTYSRILQSVPDERRDDVIRLLQLLVYSVKPLGLDEAVDAIAVNLAAKPYFDLRHRTPIPSEIIGSCSGLVIIERVHDFLHKHWEVIQLTHFSVQQYLKSEKVDLGWKRWMSEGHAMASNAKLCLAYCFSFPRPHYFHDLVGDLPFASTAAEHWAQHAMHLEAQDHQLYEMIQDFLLSDEASNARYQWIHMETMRVNLVPERTWYNEEAEPDELLPLTIASACGLYKSVESLLISGANPDEFCPVWGTALCAASHRGHYKIIKLLLNHGARPNMRAGRADLSIAIRSPSSTKRSEIFYALLQHDADVNACDRSLSFPLISAVVCGDEDIIDTLLAQGVEVDAVDYQGKFAISEAAAKGNDTVVRKLLDHRADVNLSDDINGTALVSACRGGHKEVVRTLLKNGALVCQQPEQRLFPKNALEAACDYDNQEIFALLIEHANERESFSECLGLACDLGRTGIVEILLKHKADVNATSHFGSPLLVAFTNGNEQLVQLLIHHGAKINQVETVSYAPSGSLVCGTPLLLAIEVLNNKARTEYLKPMAVIQAARLQTLKTLIAAGADVNISDDRGQTPLHYAVVSNSSESPKLIGILTEAGAVLDNVDEQGQTPIIKAVTSGAVRCHNAKIKIEERLEILLKAGAKTNVRDVDGRTALHHAAKYGYTEVCTMLIEAGAKTEIQDVDGKTALFLAGKYGEPAVCKILLRAGAKTDIQAVDGDTALHCAVWKNHPEICTMLVEAGANVNIQGMRSETALHIAAYDGQLDICATLVEAGADTNVQNLHGEIALHGAVRGSHLELCTLLLTADANANIQDAIGMTALHIAAALDGQLSICKVLIEAGANFDAWDTRGLTALQVAEEENNSEVVALLRSYFQKEEDGMTPSTG